ncbi:hypothetical protein OE88DRAFT_666820 [Heliocybe sulcata]|uniref:Uncharacterized protein n=1 Tax=Heliocybe sulcata TaxID=5364 RepID=A0A5C3NFZ7_9AGAM|nr:hypothetical protein OE88DRAFT_666820 [Heliocybe sulcata]
MPLSLCPPSCLGRDLPDFSTLLIKGRYHSSAPIHLCLNSVRDTPDSKALLLTPSRQAFVEALQELDDDWLALFAGTGRVSGLCSRVEVHYPPTTAHLAFFLSALRNKDTTEENGSSSIRTAYSKLRIPCHHI